MRPGSCSTARHRKPFDFVEVGTSDFRTLVQFLVGTDTSCSMGRALLTLDPEEAVGLVVEPVGHLLERLPNLAGVYKLRAAMGAVDGYKDFWCVRADALQRFPHNYSAWLARGTGTLGELHPQLKDRLAEDGIEPTDVMTRQRVPVWSFGTLAWSYNIGSIDVLKLDCEGADCEVLHGLMDYCDSWPETFPRIIAFETNDLSCEETVKRTISRLNSRGYEVLSKGRDTILKRRSPRVLVCCAFLRGECPWGRSCFFDHQSSQDAARGCCLGWRCAHGHGGALSCCCRCDATPVFRSCYCEDCWRRKLCAEEARVRSGWSDSARTACAAQKPDDTRHRGSLVGYLARVCGLG